MWKDEVLPQRYSAKLNPDQTLRASLYTCPRAAKHKGREYRTEPPGYSFRVVQSGSQQPHVASERLKCARCDRGTELSIAFNLDYLKFKQPPMAHGCHMTARRLQVYPHWAVCVPLPSSVGQDRMACHSCPQGSVATTLPIQNCQPL